MAQENAGKRFEGYTVYDQHYEKVGKVDDLFVDENDSPEYIGVKMGLFGDPSTLIPMDIVRVNDARQLVEVASDKETIKSAPSFGNDADITSEFEDSVYVHFGATREVRPVDRGGYGAYQAGDAAYGGRSSLPKPASTRAAPPEYVPPTEVREAEYASDPAGGERRYTDPQPRKEHAAPRDGGRVYELDIGAEPRETGVERSGAGTTGSGEFRGHDRDREGVARSGGDLDDRDEFRVQRSEEELRVGTRGREAGSVKVRKRVRVDRERLSVPTRREEVSVERVPVSGEATEAQIGEDEVSVPVVEDEVVVQKRAVAKEEIRIRKDVVRGEQIVEEDVRREEVEIEDHTRRGGQ